MKKPRMPTQAKVRWYNVDCMKAEPRFWKIVGKGTWKYSSS